MIVIGVDPGGERGTTGMVRCEGWEKKVGRWPVWLPGKVEELENRGVTYLYERVAADRPAQVLNDWVESFALDWRVAIEDTPAAAAFLKSTIQQVGAFRYAAHPAPTELVQASTVRAWLLGGKAPKGKGDSLVDQALLEAYGGQDVAVGGKKCPACGGKGRQGKAPKNQMFNYGPDGMHIKAPNPHLDPATWEGRTLDVGVQPDDEGWDPALGGDRQIEYRIIFHKGKWFRACDTCQGQKESPRGPLYPLWKPKSLQHCRAALAVAVYCYNEIWRKE